MARTPRQQPMREAYPDNMLGKGYGPIAHCHWGAGELLFSAMRLPAAANPNIPHSWQGAPAICEYWAALECFINEYSAQQVMLGRFTEDVSAAVQDATGKDKIKAFLDHLGIKAAFNAAVAADIKLFIKIRNLAYHHSPKVISINIYPDPIVQIINRLKCRHGQAVWTIYLEHIHVVEWGREAVLNFLEEFERLEKPAVSVLDDAFNGWLEKPLE
jgi:hypothetical protein